MLEWSGLSAYTRQFTLGRQATDFFSRKLAGVARPVIKTPGTKSNAVHRAVCYVKGATPAAAITLFQAWLAKEIDPDNPEDLTVGGYAVYSNCFLRRPPEKQGQIELRDNEYHLVFALEFEETGA